MTTAWMRGTATTLASCTAATSARAAPPGWSWCPPGSCTRGRCMCVGMGVGVGAWRRTCFGWQAAQYWPWLPTRLESSDSPVHVVGAQTPLRSTCLQDSQGASPPYVSEVHLAGGPEALWLSRRLRELSAPWGATIKASTGSARQSIPLQGEAGAQGLSADSQS